MKTLARSSLSAFRMVTLDIFACWRCALTPLLARAKGLFEDRKGHVVVEFSGNEIRMGRIASGKVLNSVSCGDLKPAQLATLFGKLREASGGRSDIIARLGEADSLRRRIDLPNASTRSLRGALRYEIERVSPLDIDRVAFDFSVLNRIRKEKKAHIEFRLVKRALFERIAAFAEAIHANVAMVEFAGEARPRPWLDYPVDRIAAFRLLIRRSATTALLVLVLLLTAAIIGIAYCRGAVALQALEVIREEERARMMEIAGLRAEAAAITEQLGFLVREKESPLSIAILDEIAEVLPDGTWITVYQRSGDAIRLEGYSSAASQIIGAFQATELVGEAAFRSSLTREEAGNLDRFDLALIVGRATP